MSSSDRRLVVVNPTRPTDLEFEIVVAHYNEPLAWLNEHYLDCCIYSKGKKNAPNLPLSFTPLPNIGREGHTFLYHIVSRYDELADVTLFLQGRIDDHVNISLDEMKQISLQTPPGEVTTFPFRELERFDYWGGIPWDKYPCWKRWSAMDSRKMKETPIELFQKYISETNDVPEAIGFAPGAIFAVRKETIRKHSKDYYQRLLEKMFLGDMAHPNPETGHYMERFWLAMFNPEEYVQWSKYDISYSERNDAGQLAKGRWYRIPTGSATDLGAARRGPEPSSPIPTWMVRSTAPESDSSSLEETLVVVERATKSLDEERS
ncbi:MAG: hypothetical protein Q9174_005429 [Haloplaca sp. 1 TL-2023]